MLCITDVGIVTQGVGVPGRQVLHICGALHSHVLGLYSVLLVKWDHQFFALAEGLWTFGPWSPSTEIGACGEGTTSVVHTSLHRDTICFNIDVWAFRDPQAGTSTQWAIHSESQRCSSILEFHCD